jgi:Tol biopolymer transport system component/DNA-binding winged helix-turn-helix (wHTH) protein
MAETEGQVQHVRFGNFEADLRAGELRKAGVKLKFGGQPFQVLAFLLEHAGEVVTREELQKRLWPDTFVDVDHNLNTAINKIREALGDSAESPRYVETLPRRGYRFIGELEPPVQPEIAVQPDRGSHARQPLLKITAGVLAIAVFAFGALAVYRWYRPERPQEQTALNVLPFTSLPGEETSPAFSHDGSRIAFAWNGDPANAGKGFDVYVKAVGSETMLRLTRHPSEWISAAWSPDGTQIAFHRMAGADTGIYVVPALGGPERKLRSTRIPWSPFTTISWSPDGKWIAFADLLPEGKHAKIELLYTETLETKRIPHDPKCLGEGDPAFSHDGKNLAYVCMLSRDEFRLNSLPLPDGKPKVLSHFQGFINGLTWSADDKKLIYAHGTVDSFALGEVTVANGSVKRLSFAGNAVLPAVSSVGEKLAFSSESNSEKIWRRDLLHPEAPAVELIASTRAQCNAQYSPEGKRVAFASERAGAPGVWISNEDGSDLIQISNSHDESGSPQWSPDGKKIAFDSRRLDRWEIYVADVTEGNPRKLVTNFSHVYGPHWSRDGKWIYFRSYEVGRSGVYRCPASGGDAVALSQDVDGVSPQESLDGKTLYFASVAAKTVLKRLTLPAQPGTESEVEGLPRLRSSELWAVAAGGIYFVPAEAPKSVRYFDFASKQIRPIFEVDRNFGSGLSVSPDGRWIMYSQFGDVNSDIMLVDHFH